jgi:hypothetical protein
MVMNEIEGEYFEGTLIYIDGNYYWSTDFWNHAPTGFRSQRERFKFIGSRGWFLTEENEQFYNELCYEIGESNFPKHDGEYIEIRNGKIA